MKERIDEALKDKVFEGNGRLTAADVCNELEALWDENKPDSEFECDE